MFKVLIVIAAVFTAMIYAPATPAHAETCAAHLASHGVSKSADIEYHILHGGESPCKEEQDRQQAANNSSKSQTSGSDSYRESNDGDRKSRYCRKNWFC